MRSQLTLLLSCLTVLTYAQEKIEYINPRNNSILEPEEIHYIQLLSGKDLETIDQFPNVTHIKVGAEVLATIANQSQICLLSQAKHLDLSESELREFPEGLFCLNHIETIILDQNKIQNLSSISSFENLRVIHINGNGLTSVPRELSKSLGIQELELKNNAIEKLSGLNKHQFTRLHIGHNNLKEFPKSFASIETLRDLDISDNGIADLSEFKISEMDLNFLNISHNKFSEMPEEVFALRNLKELNISYNQVEEVSEKFKLFQELTSLNLEENPLYSFTGISYLTKLSNLSISHSPVRAIPKEFSQLSNLQTLDASRCLIKNINSLTSLNISDLNLSENKIEIFPENLDLESLQKLNIMNNPIQSIAGVIRSCQNLSVLKGSFESVAGINEIYELKHLEDLELSVDISGPVPLGIGQLKKLNSLNLSSCNILDISILSKNTLLKTLNLSNNEITEIPEIFTNLNELVLLDLSSNPSIENYSGLKGLKNLREINLNNNQLEYIPEEIYYLKNIEILHLKGNNISEEEIKLFQERFPDKKASF